MMTVSICSSTQSTELMIMLNSHMITRNNFVYGGRYESETIAMVLNLHAGDNIWVETSNAVSLTGGSYNSFSIIKVK